MGATGNTREERNAFQRGYTRGFNHRWPEHMPPFPPEPIVAQLMTALQALRNELDTQLAMMDKDDPWEEKFGPLIDQADNAMRAVTEWLTPSPPHSGKEKP